MRQVPEDDQSVGTAISMGHSFHKDHPEKGSKCNLFDEQDNKSLRRQSAIYHVSNNLLSFALQFYLARDDLR